MKQTFVVTGATSGIGLATAEALAALGGRVVMVARSEERAREVAAGIRAKTAGADVDYVLADFAELASVRRGAEALLAKCPRIEVLVNNAAVLHTSRRETVDGYEATFAVNQLAPFLLTSLLLERVKSSGTPETPARIVNVASEAHKLGRLDLEDLDSRRSYSAMRVYGSSKRANIVFTYELARRIAGSPVTANCLHPGAVRTGLGRNNAPRWLGNLVYGVLSPLLRKPANGAETSVFLAVDAGVRAASGAYFKDKRAVRSHEDTYDEALAAALWAECERRVRL